MCKLGTSSKPDGELQTQCSQTQNTKTRNRKWHTASFSSIKGGFSNLVTASSTFSVVALDFELSTVSQIIL